MKNLIGREIIIKRGRLNENMIIEEITEIFSNVFSVKGRNLKRQMTITMDINEINENILGGN